MARYTKVLKSLTHNAVGKKRIEAVAPAGGGIPGGSDTQMQYNNAGSFGATNHLYWIAGSDRLYLSGTTAELRVGNYGQSAGINFGNNADRIFTDSYTMYIQNNNSMIFNIDSNNNHTGQKYEWRHNAEGAGGTALMTLGDDGNLGIGTSAPDTSLHTSGDITVQGGDIYFGNTDKIRFKRGGTTYFQALTSGGSAAGLQALGVMVNNAYGSTPQRATITIGETGSKPTAAADYGYIWVSGSSPNKLYFTNDDGTDFDLTLASTATGTIGGSVTDNQIAFGATTANSIEGSANLTFDGTTLTYTSTDAGSAAGPELDLFRNSASPLAADYIGQVRFLGESSTGVQRTYAKITGKIGDPTNSAEDGIIEMMTRKNGSNNIAVRLTDSEFKIMNDTALGVSGLITASGGLTLPATSDNFTMGGNAVSDILIDGDSYPGSAQDDYLITAKYLNTVSGAIVAAGGGGTIAGSITSGKLAIGTGTDTIDNFVDALTEDNSIYIGANPTSTTSTAEKNTALGIEALDAVTTGDHNTVVGYQAASAMTTMTHMTVIGERAAGNTNTVGAHDDVYVGSLAGLNAGGSDNVMIGAGAGQSSNTQYQSVFVGKEAGFGSASSGFGNVALGYRSFYASTSGIYNTTIGQEAGYGLTSGRNNTLIGYRSGYALTTTNHNIFIGEEAGRYATSAEQNTALGYHALGEGTLTGNENVAIGQQSMADATSATKNVAIGQKTGEKVTEGTHNVIIGWEAGATQTNQNENTLVGAEAGKDLTGQHNVFLGSAAATNATSADNNVAIGRQAMSSAILTGDNNVAVGYTAGHTATSAASNVLIGMEAAYGITTAQKSVVIGTNAGYAMAGQGGSVLVGYEAGRFQDAGSGGSVAIGHQALYSGTQNYQDVAIGNNAGRKATGASASNVFLGRYAGPSTAGVVQNKLYIHNDEGTPLIYGDFSAGTVTINGTISATAKSFNIPHPLYKDKRLVHGSLEGPEHGIYIRGTIETEEKGCLIELPEYWSAMCEDYTVQLTPHGPYTVYIKEKLKDKVMVECSQEDFKFDYYIVGARTDETLEVVQDG